MAGNVRLALDLHPPKPMLVIFSDHMFYCTMPKIYVSVFFGSQFARWPPGSMLVVSHMQDLSLARHQV